MRLFRTSKGIILQKGFQYYQLRLHWNKLINRNSLFDYLSVLIQKTDSIDNATATDLLEHYLLTPVLTQEVWAAGVTYLKSRDARMEESEAAGGADCYQKVYEAERPELFFKSLAHRVAGHGGLVNIRNDSAWNVPEPELTLFINSRGNIEAYTIGNDMSSRSIEGENPLYLPQAKVYDGSAAIGPCLYVPEHPIAKETMIGMEIYRDGSLAFRAEAPLSRMKRSLPELATYLFRALTFTDGCFLMTGTCLVPPASFTLAENDRVEISIEGIGTLINTVGVLHGAG